MMPNSSRKLRKRLLLYCVVLNERSAFANEFGALALSATKSNSTACIFKCKWYGVSNPAQIKQRKALFAEKKEKFYGFLENYFKIINKLIFNLQCIFTLFTSRIRVRLPSKR